MAVLGDDAVLLVIDAVERSVMPARVVLGGRVRQPEAAHALALEGLGDGHRAVDELQLGRQERHLDPIGGQRVQGQQRLQPGDPAAGDQHARTRIGW
jgi:hypothetical protein